MSLQDVERVRAHLHQYQRDHPRGRVKPGSPVNNVEMSTRQIVVDPVFRKAGRAGLWRNRPGDERRWLVGFHPLCGVRRVSG